MSRSRGLGRGLSQLIREPSPLGAGEAVQDLELSLIDPNPYQPRRRFDPEELAELANSIAAQGLLQPITVRRSGARYQLVAGERRLRATRDLGHTRIRSIVRDVSDRQMLELALVENLLRSDLNDIETAEALAELSRRHGYSAAQLAQVLGKSRPAVANTLRLLDLPTTVKDLVRDGRLSAGHGRTVLAFPTAVREQIAAQAVEHGWSVRELEHRAAELAQGTRASSVGTAGKPSASVRGSSAGAVSAKHVRRAEAALMEHLGTKVSISDHGAAGTISVSYHGAEDLERILSLLLAGSDPV